MMRKGVHKPDNVWRLVQDSPARSVGEPSRPVSFRDDDAGWLHMAL